MPKKEKIVKPKILYAASECGSYGKAGGLGEVVYSYPRALLSKGIEIRRVVPLYRGISCKMRYITDFPIIMNGSYETCIVKASVEDEVTTYFICNDRYFNREKIYGYYDDGERFLFFSKAVAEMLQKILYKPNIVHCNDWHTGLIPFLINKKDMDVRSVFTIHNLKCNGYISYDYIKEITADSKELDKISENSMLNFLKAAISYSDYLTTVSVGYMKEILTSKMGEGLHTFLNKKKDKLKGIRNGVDLNIYNPKNEDIYIPYDIATLHLKKQNKLMLKQELSINEEDVPLMSCISRLDDQKGIDLLIEVLQKKEFNGFHFVIMGSGNCKFEQQLTELEESYRGKFKYIKEYNMNLAKKIYAGSDIYVMPSKFEPGGLGQIYAMLYGTVPVVRSTGGLKDTVIDIKEDSTKANGICFNEYSVYALNYALNRILLIYNTQDFKNLIMNSMRLDFSFEKPLEEYIDLYKNLIQS